MPKSSLQIEKLCQHCDEPFIACTHNARFCKGKECHKSRMRDYFREYNQRPEPKIKKRERNRSYVPTPHMIQHKKDRERRPEVKEQRNKQARARYRNLAPEAKEKRLAYNRKYSADRKKKRKEVWGKIEAKAKGNAPPITQLTHEQYAQLKAQGM